MSAASDRGSSEEGAAQSGTKEAARPRIYLDQHPRIVAYQLGRLSNEQLVLVDRSTSDSKYRPVYDALLTREGLERRYREEAIGALVALNESDAVTEIVAGLGKAEANDPEGSVYAQLTRLLLEAGSAALDAQRERIRDLAGAPRARRARAAAFAALAVCSDAATVWELASNSDGGRLALITALLEVSDAKRRNAYYARLKPLVDAESQPELRRAVIDVLPVFANHHAETFGVLADCIERGIDPEVAMRSILRVPTSVWPDDALAPLSTAVVEYALRVPVRDRTSASFLNAAALGEELAARLDAESGRRARDTLAELAVTVVRVRTVPHGMQFEPRRVAVEAGRPVEIVVENRDMMPHNFVLTAPGARREVGLAAQRMSFAPDERGRHFVPRSDRVLQATRLLRPGTSEKLFFVAPEEPGDYPYVCTFPGHWLRMYGKLVVVEDLEEYRRNPPTDDVETNHHQWKMSDFAASDLADLPVDRSESGRDVFTEGGCAQCHKVGAHGAAFGPDLTEVFTRWKGSTADILREVIEPSRTVEADYANHLFVLNTGAIVTGMLSVGNDGPLTVRTGPEAGQTHEIQPSDILERKKLAMSIMPAGLLDPLTRQQVLDLLTFLRHGETRGGAVR